MQLSTLRPAFDAQGPFATVYLESRSPSAKAGHEARLRWDQLRERLANAGATNTVLGRLDSALLDTDSEDMSEVQADGRVLVASDAGLVFHERWDAAAGAGDDAHWSDRPELGAYVREAVQSVRLLVAIVDQNGARVRQEFVTPAHQVDDEKETGTTGSAIGGAHKPREGALAHNQIQRRAEENVKQNARDVVDHLDSVVARFAPDVFVLAGETKGRSAVKAELSDELNRICKETDRGGTDDDAAEQALADELREIAEEEDQRRTSERTQRFEQAQAHDLAVEGSATVTRAAEMGAVGTLVLEYDRDGDDEAGILELGSKGDSEVDVVNRTLDGGIGAILRFAIDG